MKRRPFTSYTDAFYRVKGLTRLAILGAEKLAADNDRSRVSRGMGSSNPAELAALKERLRETRAELNRMLRQQFGKRRK